MSSVNEPTHELVKWYQDTARPFLAEHSSAKVEDLDRDLEKIHDLEHREHEELAICFLGMSGVGKSTLINALVAGKDIVLPAGGVGPLTAQAMEVRFGEEPSFTARYHGPGALWRLAFALQRSFADELGSPGSATELAKPPDAEAEEIDAGDEPREDGNSKPEAYRKQAALLIKGDPLLGEDLRYLLDGLREVIGQGRVWGTELLEEDRARFEKLTKAVAFGKDDRPYHRRLSPKPDGFFADLEDHAAGFLAPVIRQIQVQWNSPSLPPGVVLVDLPGLGVHGDPYQNVTRDWILKRAKAVVLVVNRSGVTNEAARLLRDSEFLLRVLYSADDPDSDPVVLVAAGVQLDIVAEEEFAKDREHKRKKREHFSDVRSRMAQKLRLQLKSQLEAAWDSGDQSLRQAKNEVIDRIVKDAKIFGVSAVQHRRVLAADPDDAPFIVNGSESGIDEMAQGLREVVEARRWDARRAREDRTYVFIDRITSTAKLVYAQWEQEDRSAQELEQLRAELDELLRPLRREFDVRRGEYRGFLKSVVPERIASLVHQTREQASRSIRRYLQGLQNAHWGTLRAAVRREGAWDGARNINLPVECTERFIEPIAQVWGKTILQEIRRRTREFAQDCVLEVEKVAEWCNEQGARVSPALLKAQIDEIKVEAKQIDLVGKDAIDNLREEVRKSLGEEVIKPIRRKCTDFVRKGDDMGPGVKRRILELFDVLADESTQAATTPAIQLLNNYFKEVETDLRDALKHYENPLESAVEAILSSHEQRLRRGDAKKRAHVLAEATEVLQSVPVQLNRPESAGV